jgi:TolB protein
MQRIFLLVIFIFSFACVVNAQVRLKGEVTKVDDHNPTAAIVSYSGDARLQTSLSNMLSACDWFTVIKSGDANAARAMVKLSATGTIAGPEFSLSGSAEVTGRGNYALSSRGNSADEAAADFTDKLLKALFNVPALCTRRIVYVQTGKNGLKELFSCNITGGEAQRLTHNNAISTEPAWGHSGALVYTLNAKNSLSIVLFDMLGNRQRVVSSARGLNSNPALSRNGQYIALPMSFGKQVDLFLIDLKTNKRTRLTQDRSVESSPSFSPDGTKLCYVSDKSGRPQIYVMDLENKTSKRLTQGGEAVSPEWSAVSNKICFAQRASSGQYVIKVLDMANAGSEATTITDAAGNWEAPSWGPDGRHVVCTRKSSGSQKLYMVDSWLHAFQVIPVRASGISLPAWQSAR